MRTLFWKEIITEVENKSHKQPLLKVFTDQSELSDVPVGCPSTTHTAPSSVNKAAHYGFETQRRHHLKSKTGSSVVPQKCFLKSCT